MLGFPFEPCGDIDATDNQSNNDQRNDLELLLVVNNLFDVRYMGIQKLGELNGNETIHSNFNHVNS